MYPPLSLSPHCINISPLLLLYHMLPHIDGKYSPLSLYPRLLRENSWLLTVSNWWGLCCFLPAILRQAKRSPRASSPASPEEAKLNIHDCKEKPKQLSYIGLKTAPLNISGALCCPIVCRAGWSCFTARQGPVLRASPRLWAGMELIWGSWRTPVLSQGSDFSLLIPWVTSVVLKGARPGKPILNSSLY